MERFLKFAGSAVLAAAVLAPRAYPQDVVAQVRAATSARDFARGDQLISAHLASRGVTPEAILALSWMARGAQAAAEWQRAEQYASETRRLALAELKKRPLDAEHKLPLALGASIEVHAHALAARNARGEALDFLAQELKTWHATSIRARIQKNINLLGLAGKPAPPLEITTFVGERPAALRELKGRPVILFFWAHWCGDCKQQKASLLQVQREYAARGLAVIGVTQRYGYVAGGADATPEQELRYIGEVREKYYADLLAGAAVSEELLNAWGASTTPTLVVLDRAGIVKLYQSGRIAYEKLAPVVAEAAGR